MRSKYKFLFVGVVVLACLVCGAIGLTCCTKSDFEPERQTAAKVEKFRLLEEQWNQYADKYSQSFKLFGERGGLDSNIIAALNKWLEAFQKKPEENYLNELSRLEAEVGQTTFHQWENFKKDHYRPQRLVLTTDMTPRQAISEMNKYIGVGTPSSPLDYISPETVQTIVYMNSLCAFFDGEKNRLHDNGIDTKISSCSGLSTKGRYSELDAVIE